MIIPKFVSKSWGWEYWFSNVDEKEHLPLDSSMVDKYRDINYCGKLLYVEYNKWSSNFKYHYHNHKDETFMVLEGCLYLDYIKVDDSPASIILKPLETFRVKPGMKHRFTSASETGCKFIEVSTFHSDSDSYRCTYDARTRKWIVIG